VSEPPDELVVVGHHRDTLIVGDAERVDGVLQRIRRAQARHVPGECSGDGSVTGAFADRALDVGRGDDADERAARFCDRQRIGPLGREPSHDPVQRLVGRQGVGRPAHCVSDADLRHPAGRAGRVDVDPPPAELVRVDRVGGESTRERGSDDDREHQRQDDAVVPRELEDDDQGGDRRPGGGGEHRAHPDETIGARRGGQTRKEVVGQGTVCRAEHRAHEQRRREHAARATDPHRQARRHDLRRQQTEQDKHEVVAGDGAFEHRIADAVHLRNHEEQEPEQHPAGGRSEPSRSSPQSVRHVLARIQQPDEGPAHAGGERSEARVQHELERRAEVESG